MKIPTPSFPRIRLVIVVIAFFLFCFFVGLVKQVFAGLVDAQCVRETYTLNEGVVNGCIFNHSLPYFKEDGTVHGAVSLPSNCDNGTPIYNGYIALWYNEGGGPEDWTRHGSVVYNYSKNIPSGQEVSAVSVPPTGGCPCSEEDKQAAYDECGGEENTNWSETTCTYTCKICQGEGEESPAEAVERCGGIELLEFHDPETCRGICKDTCTQEEYNQAKDQCGKQGFDFSEVTCEGECKYCDADWAQAKADSICAGIGKGKALGYTCNSSPEDGHVVPPDSVTCDGGTIKQYPRSGKDYVPEPDGLDPSDPNHPDNKDELNKPEDPQDPNNESERDQALKNSLDTQIDQLNKVNSELNRQTDIQNWIGKNSEATAHNTQGILQQLQDGISIDDSKGLGKEVGKIGDDIGVIKGDIDHIDDTLNDIANGDFTTPEEQEAYKATEDEYSFSDRTSEFLEDMRETGMFSLPDKIADSIPGGGSSLFTVDMGDTFGGIHNLNLDYLSKPLLILRSFYLIGCMAIAIRIVTLKR